MICFKMVVFGPIDILQFAFIFSLQKLSLQIQQQAQIFPQVFKHN